MCVGLLSDREALKTGFLLLALLLFTIIALGISFAKCKKQIKDIYDKNSIDGLLDYELTKQSDRFHICCVQNGEVVEFSKTDIRYKRTIGSFIVVKLKGRIIVCMPKTEEISLLLK